MRDRAPASAVLRAPAVVPVVCLLSGLLFAGRLSAPSPLAWSVVLGLGLALGRVWSRGLAAFAAGVVWALVFWLPQAAPLHVDPRWPVHAVLRIVEPWRPTPFGWVAAAEMEGARQGRRLLLGAGRQVRLALPLDARTPDPGSRVRASGLMGRPPGYANEAGLDPGPLRLVVKTPGLIESLDPPTWLGRLSSSLRSRVGLAVLAAADRYPHGAALARGLVLGEESALPDGWRRALRRSGLLHVFAASGFNVSLLAAAVLLATARLHRFARWPLAGSAVALYVVLVGPQPAMLRAALMAGLAIVALLVHRPPWAANALAVSAALLALARPAVVGELGFQLTLAATAGLLFLAPPLAGRWRLRRAWARPIAASVAAQIATLPWALTSFHLISPLALAANLIFLPWSGLALIGTLVWCAVGVASPGWAAFLAPVLAVLAAPFDGLAETGADLWWVIPSAASIEAALAATVAVVAVAWWPRPLALPGLLLLLLLGRPSDAELEARFLDVGQGDAILLRDGERAVLVDGGGTNHGDLGGRVLLPELAAAGVRRIDLAILTHRDLDHCQGLVDLADYLTIREVWVAPGSEGFCATRLATGLGANLRVVWSGDTGAIGRWRLRVLNPPPGEHRGDNDRSLVLDAEAAGLRVLLAGDVEAGAERHLLEGPAVPRFDVLKVAHHGSRTSSTAQFLEAVRPRFAVISAGIGNRFGHPSAEALSRLRTVGARVLRTDLDGEVLFRFGAKGSHRGWRLVLPGAPR